MGQGCGVRLMGVMAEVMSLCVRTVDVRWLGVGIVGAVGCVHLWVRDPVILKLGQAKCYVVDSRL